MEHEPIFNTYRVNSQIKSNKILPPPADFGVELFGLNIPVSHPHPDFDSIGLIFPPTGFRCVVPPALIGAGP